MSILVTKRNGHPEIDGMRVTFDTKAIRADIESLIKTNEEFYLAERYTFKIVNSVLGGKVTKIIFKHLQ